MRAGNRFCGRCGHELRPAGRFCGNCGHAVPASAGQAGAQPGPQDPGAAPQQAPDLPAFAPTLTAWPGPPARTARRPAYLLPLVAVLAVLVAGGGSVAAVLTIRHFYSRPTVQDNLAANSPPSASPAPSSPPPSPTLPPPPPTPTLPPPPPTQVTMDGMTIGIGAVNTDPDATAVAATLAAYFGGIDAGQYMQAWDTYSAALQEAVPFQPWANGLSTSQDNQVVMQSIRHDAGGNLEADVSFQSHQAGQYGPNQGETCTDWSLDYHLVPDDNATTGSASLSYLIDKVTDIGSGHTSC